VLAYTADSGAAHNVYDFCADPTYDLERQEKRNDTIATLTEAARDSGMPSPNFSFTTQVRAVRVYESLPTNSSRCVMIEHL